MTNRIPCSTCGALILPSTVEKNAGLCMPCYGGYREHIEKIQAREQQDRLHFESKEYLHWVWLVDKVYQSDDGFYGLIHPDKLFFAVHLLSREVYNGGFEQYFSNSSADYYPYAVAGLIAMEAPETLKLLNAAKKQLFGDANVPLTQQERWSILHRSERNEAVQEQQSAALEQLDRVFYTDPDQLDSRLNQFIQLYDLHEDF